MYISRLRKLLGGAAPRLLTRPAGYQLVTQPGELDSERFVGLVAEGRQAVLGGRFEVGGQRLTQALGLWRGGGVDRRPVDAGGRG